MTRVRGYPGNLDLLLAILSWSGEKAVKRMHEGERGDGLLLREDGSRSHAQGTCILSN